MPRAWPVGPFERVFAEPLRNGLTKPGSMRGTGLKMVTMGEIFAHDRIAHLAMDRAPLTEGEVVRFTLQTGDLLFARQSLVLSGAGKCSIFLGDEEPVTFEGHLIRARLDASRADSRFYYYYFNSPQGRRSIAGITEQVAAAGIRSSDLTKLPVPLPPLAEQRAIAAILGAFDDKIDLDRRRIATLEALAGALFQAWFVDDEPVRGRAAGRALKPPAEVVGQLLDGVDELDGVDLGNKQLGWRVGVLSDLVGLLPGYAFKSRDWVERGVPVVKIGSIKSGIVDLDQISHVAPDVAGQAQRYQLRTGDLLIAMTGTVGAVALVPHTTNPPLLNQRVAKVLLENEGTGDLAYVYCLLRSEDFRFQVAVRAHGSVQPNISASAILSIETVIPPVAVRARFNVMLQPVLDRILATHLESQQLASLRDTLLPKLVTGELRVSAAMPTDQSCERERAVHI